MQSPRSMPSPSAYAHIFDARAVSRALYADDKALAVAQTNLARYLPSPRPLSPIAQDLFDMGVMGSRHIGAYAAICCAPNVGRNLSAKA